MKYIKRSWKKILIIIGVLLLDLWTKSIFDEKNITIISGVFKFLSKHNSGGAWSILEGYVWLITLIGIIVLITIVIFDIIMKEKNIWYNAGMGLILGGALGNLIDRLVFGYVRDFIYVEIVNFPVFNVADVALNVGVIVFAIFVFFIPSKVQDPLLKKDVTMPEISDLDKEMVKTIKEQFKDEAKADKKALRKENLKKTKSITKDNHWIRPKDEIAEDREEMKDILQSSNVKVIKVKPAKKTVNKFDFTVKKQQPKVVKAPVKEAVVVKQEKLREEIRQELKEEIRSEVINELRNELINEIGEGLKLGLDSSGDITKKTEGRKGK